MLSQLVDDGFLDVERPEEMSKAYRYGLAHSISPEDRERWIELGTLLFSPTGLRGNFHTRPSTKHRHIMLNGFLVLSILLRCGPQKGTAIMKTMAPIMTRSTTARRLKFLTENGILQCVDGMYSATPDWEEAVTRYEKRHSLDITASNLERKIEDQRTRHYEDLAGGPEVVKRMRLLRLGSCIECGLTPAGEVEHFPPRVWGGFNHLDLMYSVCSPCNNRWSNIVKSLKPPNYQNPGVMHLLTDFDVSRIADAGMDFVHILFLRGARSGDLADLQAATNTLEWAYPLWYYSSVTKKQCARRQSAGYQDPARLRLVRDWETPAGIANRVIFRETGSPDHA